MADMNTEIKIGADASGVEAGVGRAKRSLKDLGDAALQASRDAAKGLGGVGEGGDKAARQVESATKSVVSSLQRQIAAFEAGGRGTRAYQESMARLNGIDVNAIKPLLDRLDESKAKSEAAAKSANTAAISFERMGISAKAASDTFSTLAVAGLGITAVVGAVTAVSKTLFDASVAAERLKIGLDFASGGNGARELTYVTDLSNKLGLSLQSTASSYMSFAAASRGTALEGAAAKNVFEAVAKASAVMGLTSEQSSGALLALQQMMSKGTVQAEELRGQLGERLPGAFQIAARSMGVTTQELGKMLETGKVLADDFLPRFAAQLENEIGGGAEKAANRLGAATNRIETAIFRMKTALGDSGIAELYAAGLNRGTSVFNAIAGDVEKLNSQGGLRRAADDVNTLHTRQMILKGGIANGFYGKGFQVELDAVSAKLEIAKQKFREVDAASKAILAGAGGGRGSVNPTTTTQLFAKDAANKAERDAYYAQDIRQTKEQIRTEEIGKARKANALLVAKAEGDTNEVLKLQKALSIEIANINERNKDKRVGGGAGGDSELAGLRARGIEIQRYIDSLKVQGLEADKQTASEKIAAKYREELNGGLKGAARATKELQLAQAEKNAGLEKEQAAIVGLLKAQQDFEAARDREAVSRQSVILKIEEQAQALEDEIEMYGKGKAAVEALTIARLEANKADISVFSKGDPKAEAAIQQINDKIAGLKRLAAAGDGMAALKMGTHTDQLLANAKEQASLYEDELKLTGLTALERAKVVAQRQVEIKYAKELAKIDASQLSDSAKEVERQKVNEARQIEGSAAVNKVIQDDWAKTADQINQSLTDALMRGFESGKSFAMNLRDTVVNMFKTMVLRPIISAVMAPVSGAVNGVVGAGMNAVGLGGGSMVNGASNAYSLYGAASGYSSGVNTAAGLLGAGSTVGASAVSLGYANAVGAVGGDALGALIAGNASWGGVAAGGAGAAGAAGAGAGAATGAAAGLAAVPVAGWIALAAIAAYAIFSGDKDPASQSTGDTRANYDKNGNKTSSDNRFGFESAQTTSLTDALQKSYAGMAASLGIGVVDSNFGVGGNSDGKVAHFGIGSNAGGVNYTSADNIEYSEEKYQLEASRAVISALKGSELPRYLTGVFDGLTASTATQDQINQVLAYAQALKKFDETLQVLPFDNLREQSYGAMQGLIAASGGLEQLQTNLGFYFENFYSDSERAAAGMVSLTAEFAKLGLSVPDNAAQLRDMISAQDASTVAGQGLIASLLGLAPAFASAASAAAAAASAMSSAIQNYGSSADLRNFQVDQIRQGLANGGLNLTNAQIAGASRDDALAAYNHYVSAGDTRSADAIFSMQQQFANITQANGAGGPRAGWNPDGSFYAGGDGGGATLAEINAARGTSAADSIASAWQSITDSIWGEVKRIRGLLEGSGQDAFAAAQARFTIATAQARAGDQDAAKALPQLSQAMLMLAEDNAGTLIELQRIRAQTAASLTATGTGLSSQYGLSVPSFDVGTNYVPRDMLAMIHEGEAIVPRAYNPAANSGGGGNDEVVAELRALRSEVAALRASASNIDKNTGKTKDVLVRVTHDGEAIQMEPA